MEKQLNFIEFLIKNDRTKIPKIQREYVQGQNERGIKFAKKIFENLREDKYMTLDLVYGVENDKIFEPIDGQQRLTTLFLLYWYVCKIEKIKTINYKNDEGINIIDILKRFTYDTRSSSTEFCETLCDKLGDDFVLEKDDIPSERIMEANWYYVKYNYDYTVKSMLSMLDIIQKEYSKADNNFDNDPNTVNSNNNTNSSNGLFDSLEKIVFYNYDMKNYDRGEKLYVIMNDRGKKLTSYENFKSSLLDWLKGKNINEVQWLKLSEKIDNVWTENLWKYVKNEENKHEEMTDRRMYLFFLRYFWLLNVVLTKNTEKNVFYNAISEKIKKAEKIGVSDIDFAEYVEPVLENILEKRYNNDIEAFCTNLEYFFEYYFENMGQQDLKQDFFIAPWGTSTDDNTDVEDEDNDSTTDDDQKSTKQINDNMLYYEERFVFRSRVLNYGLLLYIEYARKDMVSKQEPKQDYFSIECNEWKEWKRFVWNIFEATSAKDSIESTLIAMSILDKYKDSIGKLSKDLVKNYKQADIEENITIPKAEKYEMRKAKYILDIIKSDDDWKNDFVNAEKHKYLKGYVDFLISEKSDDKVLEADTKEEFKNRWTNTKSIFAEPSDEQKFGGFNTADNHLVVRALFSKITYKDMNKDIEKNSNENISLCSYETEKSVVKTTIESFWYKYIKEFIFETNCKDKMEESIVQIQTNQDDCQDEFLAWKKTLCTNIGLVTWIQERAKARGMKVSFIKKPAGYKIYFGGWNTSGCHINLDKHWFVWIEEIRKKGYELEEATDGLDPSYEINDSNVKCTLYFGETGGKIRLKNSSDEKYTIETVDTGSIKINGQTYKIKDEQGKTRTPEEFKDYIISIIDNLEDNLNS